VNISRAQENGLSERSEGPYLLSIGALSLKDSSLKVRKLDTGLRKLLTSKPSPES